MLCKNEAKAKAIALSLAEKLSAALKEFQREKQRRQNSRLAIQRSNSLPTQEGITLPNRYIYEMYILNTCVLSAENCEFGSCIKCLSGRPKLFNRSHLECYSS